MNSSWVLKDLRFIGPELALVAALLVVILVDLTRLGRTAAFFALAGLGTAAWMVGQLLWPEGPDGLHNLPAMDVTVFQGAYAVDGFAGYFKLAFLGAALIVGIFSIPAIKDWSSGKGEFFTLLLSCTFGMMLMAGANDLLMMYVTLVFDSIPRYIMAGFS